MDHRDFEDLQIVKQLVTIAQHKAVGNDEVADVTLMVAQKLLNRVRRDLPTNVEKASMRKRYDHRNEKHAEIKRAHPIPSFDNNR